jgi:gluconokinase
MRRGVPLTDEDRAPWLAALARLVDETVARGENLVLACSALKHRYQEYLRHDLPEVRYVELWGDPQLIRERLAARKGHFMDPNLLPSQYAILEPPADAILVEVSGSPQEIASEIRRKLGL